MITDTFEGPQNRPNQGRRIAIYLAKMGRESMTVSEIVDALNIPAASVKARLSELRREEKVVCLPGGYWGTKMWRIFP